MTLRKPMKLGNVYYIDTGGWQAAGRFTLLDLHTLKLPSR
ncbi:Phosphoprotein phosphatase [plant metagenome]|uniref:Phosphoprotein phosphatase n=1 Tax=plant metagenome TaxID=1297885 RepID=A0A484PHZ6_9ZZZZ